MNIYARCRLGPEHAPNEHTMVRILSQLDDAPYGRFNVVRVDNGEVLTVWEVSLTLKWWQPREGK